MERSAAGAGNIKPHSAIRQRFRIYDLRQYDSVHRCEYASALYSRSQRIPFCPGNLHAAKLCYFYIFTNDLYSAGTVDPDQVAPRSCPSSSRQAPLTFVN